MYKILKKTCHLGKIYMRQIYLREKLKRNCQISEISLIYILTKPEEKVSIPIKIDGNHQNNHHAVNSVHFLINRSISFINSFKICKSFYTMEL
jgi:hypothetical protein